jgi:hypothetical protein
MVNAGFPAPPRYGFEMVATSDAPVCGDCRAHQSKIYGESNPSDFLQIFG